MGHRTCEISFARRVSLRLALGIAVIGAVTLPADNPRAAAQNAPDQPGTRTPAITARAATNSAVTASVVNGGMSLIANERGRVTLSMNALGTLASSGSITVVKPSGATVRRAILFAATTGSTGARIGGPVVLNGTSVAMSNEVQSSIASYNYWTDVTTIVKPGLDAAGPGNVAFAVAEPASLNIDGTVLAVIFNDPSQAVDRSVALVYGALATIGDRFSLGLDRPFDPSDPASQLEMSLGISYSCQSGCQGQLSTVDVNGRRLTSSAGGEDDGVTANGALITVGGVGDSIANPNPTMAPTGPRTDDELYDLRPFMAAGDRTVIVNTSNPSNDDNIFLAAFVGNPPISSVVTNTDTSLYAALGDSYSSGEGTGSYIPPTDQRSPEEDLCHRSLYAYSQVVQPLSSSGAQLYPANRRAFFACSGAVTRNVRNIQRQYAPESAADNLGQISHDEVQKASLITMTIGGNDAGFSDILVHCLWRDNCVGSKFRIPGTQIFGSIRKGTLRKIDGEVADNLRATYAEINTANPTAVKIALNYPNLFPGYPNGFDCRKIGNYAGAGGPNVFIDAEQQFFREASQRVSDVISREATAAGWRFVDVIPYFSGHEICGTAGDGWLNGFKGPAGLSLKPENGSFHPNAAGQAAYAHELKPMIESAANRAARPASASSVASADATSRAFTAAAPVAAAGPITSSSGAAVDASLALEPDERDLEWGRPLVVAPVLGVSGTDCAGHYVANQDITVDGSGYQPGASIAISFDSSGIGEQQLAVVTADSAGAVRANVTLPPNIVPELGQGLDAVGFDSSGRVLVSTVELIVNPVDSACGPSTALPAQFRLKADAKIAPGTTAPTANQNGNLKSDLRVDDKLAITGAVSYAIDPRGQRFESTTLTSARQLGQSIIVTGTGKLNDSTVVAFVAVFVPGTNGHNGSRARLKLLGSDGAALVDQTPAQPVSAVPPLVSGGRVDAG